jgi:hypothetical protein
VSVEGAAADSAEVCLAEGQVRGGGSSSGKRVRAELVLTTRLVLEDHGEEGGIWAVDE